ncbi:hypothetical protein NMY22_g2690 [Coprinellus aureogranulatus]|nr:hypothetical protein NMY22_g2690 [Coprinellus aureogranulatus]
MLSTQTKQINAYGKRAKRVVQVTASDSKPPSKEILSIFDDLPPPPAWAPVASRMKGRENSTPKKKTPAPKVVGATRKKRLSPPLSPPKKPVKVAEPIDGSNDGLRVKLIKPEAEIEPLKAKLKGEVALRPQPRAPLSAQMVNGTGSQALHSIVGKAKSKQRAPTNMIIPPKLGKLPSTISMDILLLDDKGRTISREKRMPRIAINSNSIDKSSKYKVDNPRTDAKSKLPIHVDSESEPEVDIQPKNEKSRKQATRVVVSDDSSSDGECSVPFSKSKLSSKAGKWELSEPKPLKRVSTIEVVIPPAPYSTKEVPRMSDLPKAGVPQPLPPRSLPRLCPPGYRPSTYPNRQSPNRVALRLSELADPNLSLDFADLSLDSDRIGGTSLFDSSVPQYLKPLLEECGQCYGPHDFSSFIESFPFDPILQDARDREGELFFKKVGEASFSEVFGIGDVVLKVIPLRDETAACQSRNMLKARGSLGHDDGGAEGPPPTDAQDVRKEIIVTRAMGEVHQGFVKLLKAYIVKGKYPEALLTLWDEYYDEKGSESVRPGMRPTPLALCLPNQLYCSDTFTLRQAYAIIVLPNGGPDLETYMFSAPSRSGWRQACSIFWQVAKSLAHAEHLVSFEHRDLHWGQVLIKNLASRKSKLNVINVNSAAKSLGKNRMVMDDLEHGVQATIIDLGLSRMDAGDGADGRRVQWTPLDEEIFTGEGDYQFDVYRMMRELIGGEWEDYHPMTNVMWLHYLASKLLRSKGLKAPTVAKRVKASGEALVASSYSSMVPERECYEALIDLEEWLGQTLIDAFPAQAKATAAAKGRGRRATLAPISTRLADRDGPACAGDVVRYGVKRGWVRPIRLAKIP